MSSSNSVRSVLGILLICIASWRSACQDTAPRCRTTAVSEGLCLILKDCPYLNELFKNLTIDELLSQYGGCGRGSPSNNVRLCCPKEKLAVSPVLANGSPPAVVMSKSADDSTCGRRVVGNGPEWPFLAAVGYSDEDSFYIHCVGAYISDRWVLVDSECVHEKNSDTYVIPGRYWKEYQQTGKNRVNRVLVSEVTDDGQLSKGVALLELENPVIFDDYVQSICLPDVRSTETPLLLSVIIFLEYVDPGLAFPPTKNERHIFLRNVNGLPGTSKTCDPLVKLPRSYNGTNIVVICTTNHYFCREYVRNPGNPQTRIRPILVEVVSTERYRLIGVGRTSRDHCTKRPHVYSSVVHHLHWIKNQMRFLSSGNSTPALPLVDIRYLDGGQQCGWSTVGEDPEFPFMVAIGKVENDKFIATCGGVIINDWWVLTQAACVSDHFITHIKIGVNTDQDGTREVALRKTHESFDPVTRPFNIALLKLKAPLIFNDHFQPVCMPSSEDVENQTMYAVPVHNEWGSAVSKVRQNFHLASYVTRERCEPYEYPSHPFNSDTICASHSASCASSEWSVLLQKHPTFSNLIVQGIGGANRNCSDETHGIRGYTQVFPYMQWILDRIQGRA